MRIPRDGRLPTGVVVTKESANNCSAPKLPCLTEEASKTSEHFYMNDGVKRNNERDRYDGSVESRKWSVSRDTIC